ncbi:hypothetical protein [Flavobacterium olei]|uniref:hypothetical protein n=1 Tax=Flavobacterium olei TaxID=1886782 RepID=UPI003218ECBF
MGWIFLFLGDQLNKHINSNYPTSIKEYNECNGWRWDNVPTIIDLNINKEEITKEKIGCWSAFLI